MESKRALLRHKINGKSINHSSLPQLLFILMDMSGVLISCPILAHNMHPCMPHRRYYQEYLAIRKWFTLDMKLDMAVILFRCELVPVLWLYMESKSCGVSYISYTLETVVYRTTWTGRPSSSNFSNWPSISFFGLDNIESKASREVFLAFILGQSGKFSWSTLHWVALILPYHYQHHCHRHPQPLVNFLSVH